MVCVQKLRFFQLFFLRNIGQENVFYDILERKNAFLGYKNKKFKKSKNWRYPKGLFWFWCMVLVQKWPKMVQNWRFFQLLFFRKYRPGKCLLRYSRTKNAFLSYKNKKFKNSKNWHFSKGVNPWFWSKNSRFPNFYF